jgi:hypothetical protein
MDDDLLFEVLLAADYLIIKDLIDVLCKNLARRIEGKTESDIRKEFNVPKPQSLLNKENSNND